MNDYTRLTLVGKDTRVDLVVASDQVLASLIPRMMDMVGLLPEDGPYALVRTLGDSLDLTSDAEGNHLLDGELIRLVKRSQAPAPPEVSDITDVVTHVRAEMPGQWNPQARQVVAVMFIIVMSALTGSFLPLETAWGRLAICGGALILLTVLAMMLGRTKRLWGAYTTCAAAGGLVVPTAIYTMSWRTLENPLIIGVVYGVIALCFVITFGIGVGLRNRAAIVSAGICGAMALTAGAMCELSVDVVAICAVIGILGIAGLGLAPAWALTISGLSGLDDFTSSGDTVPRVKTLTTIADAYKIMTWTVLGTLVLVTLATIPLATSRSLWAIGLTVVVIVVITLQSWALPSAVLIATTWCSVLILGSALIAGGRSWWRIAVMLLIAMTAAVLAVIPVSTHIRIRLRRLGDVIMKIALGISIPLLLGLFGVYDWLLGAYS